MKYLEVNWTWYRPEILIRVLVRLRFAGYEQRLQQTCDNVNCVIHAKTHQNELAN